jgi:phospholipase/lecithinase/hemolysin
MKSVFHCTIVILLFELVALPANAAFKSLYVFGDALSSTADGTGSLYYAGRDSNGRVWVEVLAQRQGLTYDATKNNSYYDHNSAITVTDVKNFTAPADVTNDLFIVWVCNADTFDAAQVPDNSTQWQAAINQAQTNHLQIITNLYARGVRTLILPNVVDISQIPAFNAGTTLTNVEHAGCVAYNVAFSNTIKQARALCPGLKIYAPDFFTLLNNVLTNAANYGLTNALSAKGFSIDALTALYAKAPVQLNGPGTNYIFWDNQDPTAEFHEVIADVVQQSISPVQIGQITALNGSNQLYVVNVPVGLNGFVDTTTNLSPASWASLQNITSTNTAQSVFVPQVTTATNSSPALSGGGNPVKPADSGGSGLLGGPPPDYIALQFYRLRFPYAWNWP